ncbi:MAG: hypothetical protein KAQ73_08405, partial [Dehalococcoidia bacterium]|nr:hypothetical protein [Dehalococcoidia bacterium]
MDLFGFDTAYVYLQCGSFGSSPGWNALSTLGIDAVEIMDDTTLPDELWTWDARAIAGLLLPEDYNSKNPDDRVLWVWVNHYGPAPDRDPMCAIMRVEDDSADPVGPMGQVEDGEIFLTNISYHGTIAEGEALAGVLGDGGYPIDGPLEMLFTDCCEGVQVYRNDGIRNMDICCERWHDACKPPTGRSAMAVTWVDDDKAYAVALGGFLGYDEGAWSVTFDDGDTWNQLSLIDTYISLLTDVAVSPDCNKTMLVSINDGYGAGCDSVWLHAENLPEAGEYSGKWLRTFSDQLDGSWGMLRLAPEETDGETVYLADDFGDTVYWNELETLACWEQGTATVDNIVDFAVKDRETIYVLDAGGNVAMSDDYALGFHDPVDSEVSDGYTIAVWGDDILVGGMDGDVTYSDDGGETFTELA